MLYFRYSKGNEVSTMTTFTMIILVVFVSALVAQFIAFVDKDCPFLACLSGAEILMFAYLARVLM